MNSICSSRRRCTRFASSEGKAKTVVSISHLADRSLSTKGKAEYELQVGKKKGNRQKERVESNEKRVFKRLRNEIHL